MNTELLPECSRTCLASGESCLEDGCRYWIDHNEEQNCSLVSVYLNGNMTLKEISERLDISLVRVSQIEKKAVKKLFKRIKM